MADQTRVKLGSTDTLTIGGQALGHILAEVSITETPIIRETLNAAHYPNPAEDIDGKKATLDIKATITSGSTYPSTAAAAALVFTGSNVYFSGQVIFDEISISGLVPDKSADVSIKAHTIDQSYSFAKSAS